MTARISLILGSRAVIDRTYSLKPGAKFHFYLESRSVAFPHGCGEKQVRAKLFQQQTCRKREPVFKNLSSNRRDKGRTVQRRSGVRSPGDQTLERLKLKPCTMVALYITTGLRRGELEAVRWEDLNVSEGYIRVKEHHYRGHIDDPKTEAGFRNAPVPGPALAFLENWKQVSKRTKPTDFIFATRNGKPESGHNILRRHVYPACDAAKLPRANWLTFRRTFSNWSHQQGIPAKDIAEMMGHSEVEMQFTYTVGVDENKRRGAERLGKQLVRISQISPDAGELVN